MALKRETLQTEEFNTILNLIYRVLDIRLAFFDARGDQRYNFEVHEMSPYCRHMRRQKEFNLKCIECDEQNVELAAKKHEIHIYRCHHGLIEGVVPLFGRKGDYLGSLVFGQLRPKGLKIKHSSPKSEKLFSKLPECTDEKAHEIATLLKYLGEYIIERELVRKRTPDWVKELDAFIDEHLEEKLTTTRLAKAVNLSQSFITHHFSNYFGQSPTQYIKRMRAEKGLRLLKDGENVSQVAKQLGFYDEFHFSKAFKSIFGLSPKHFKE